MIELSTTASYLNPVYPHSFPDPFVLKFRGEYWAFCTGFWRDSRVFGVLHSRDLIHWRELDGAMAPFPEHYPCYWAPEVTYFNNRFYLYYSVGNEERMHIRVAVADEPAGPYMDSGRQLTNEEFAIDAHVFVDSDGTRYLFYATDFLTHTHIGTGTVCDRLVDPFTLAGEARPVTRALYDWQVYDPQRAEKGGVRWHTVEGPTVLEHKNRYYQMFSGGNWQNLSYGVSYAIADNLDSAQEWKQVADGKDVLPILRTLPGKVVGPGHNSVVRGPDNRQLFAVYHLWNSDGSDRVMAIDRLEWAGERMLVIGPSTNPQWAPLQPSLVDNFNREGDLESHWKVSGKNQWVARAGELRVVGRGASMSEARCQFEGSAFLVEVGARALSGEEEGNYGLSLTTSEDAVCWRALVMLKERHLAVSWLGVDDKWMMQRVPLPRDLSADALQLLRLEVDGDHIAFRFTDWPINWQGFINREASGMALCTEGAGAAFAGFTLTAGWEDLFTSDELRRGWQIASGTWFVRDQQLFGDAQHQSHALITKGPPFDCYEMVAAVRLVGEIEADGYFGFYPALNLLGNGSLLVAVERFGEDWVLKLNRQDPVLFRFPTSFNAQTFQHFRFRKERGELFIQWEAELIGSVPCHPGPARVGLGAQHARAAFDAVRVTAIKIS